VNKERRAPSPAEATQKKWIEAARSCGIRMFDLLIVEWQAKK
jgi:hypothetical protein